MMNVINSIIVHYLNSAICKNFNKPPRFYFHFYDSGIRKNIERQKKIFRLEMSVIQSLAKEPPFYQIILTRCDLENSQKQHKIDSFKTSYLTNIKKSPQEAINCRSQMKSLITALTDYLKCFLFALRHLQLSPQMLLIQSLVRNML